MRSQMFEKVSSKKPFLRLRFRIVAKFFKGKLFLRKRNSILEIEIKFQISSKRHHRLKKDFNAQNLKFIHFLKAALI